MSGRLKIPVKPLIVFAALAIAFLVVSLTPLKEHLQNVRAIKEQLRALGWMGPVVFMAGVYVLIVLGIPRLVFCPIGGMAFGFWEGLLWTQVATMAGYYTIFLFIRWGGRDFALKHWSKLGRMQKVFDLSGIPAVVILRQLPVSGLLTNLLLGLAPVRHVDFLVGTAIGILPEAVPFTLLASGAVKLRGGESTVYVVAAAVLLLAVWGALAYAAGHSRLFAKAREEVVAEVEAPEDQAGREC